MVNLSYELSCFFKRKGAGLHTALNYTPAITPLLRELSQEAEKKYIGSIQWMAHQFNECLEGREFDFSDYQEETW